MNHCPACGSDRNFTSVRFTSESIKYRPVTPHSKLLKPQACPIAEHRHCGVCGYRKTIVLAVSQ